MNPDLLRTRFRRALAIAGVAGALVAVGACGERKAAVTPPFVAYMAVERARSDSSAALMAAYAMDVDRRGNLYVGDRWAVRIFSPAGRLLRSVGRQGRGPGEFGAIASVALLPGDSLFVFDGALGRVTVFEPGTWRPAYTVQVGRDQLPAIHVRRVREGRGLWAAFERAYTFGGPSRGGPRGGSVVAHLLNSDGSVGRESVLSVRERENLVFHRPDAVGPNPFGRTTHLAFASGDRVVAQWSDSLQFDVYSADGRRLKTARPDWVPPRRPITARERDSVVAVLADELVPERSVRRALEEHGATTWPLVQDMIVDDRDRVWMGITGGRGEPHHWTAFDLDGARVAQVDLPVNALLRLVRGSTAYVVELDENDVPHVVVYDLTPTSTLAIRR
ncbi:MAG TPA: hypothetical protein VFS20_32025 [Longimicrobium sp.]|nr:hypothetical protein [Longimicrobium sp.]